MNSRHSKMDFESQISYFLKKQYSVQQMLESKNIQTLQKEKVLDLKNDDQRLIRDLQIIKQELTQKGLKNIYFIAKGSQAYILSATKQEEGIKYKFAIKAYKVKGDCNNQKLDEQIKNFQQEEKILKLCRQKPNVVNILEDIFLNSKNYDFYYIPLQLCKADLGLASELMPELSEVIDKNYEGNILHKPPEGFEKNNRDSDIQLKQGKKSNAYALGLMIYIFIFGREPIENDITKTKEVCIGEQEMNQFQYKREIKQIIYGLTRQQYDQRMSIQDALLILKGIIYTEFNLDQLFYTSLSGPIQEKQTKNEIELICVSQNEYFLSAINGEDINKIKQNNNYQDSGSSKQLIEVQNQKLDQSIKQQNHSVIKSPQEFKQLSINTEQEEEQQNIIANNTKYEQPNNCPSQQIKSENRAQDRNQEINFQTKQSLKDINQNTPRTSYDQNQYRAHHQKVSQNQQNQIYEIQDKNYQDLKQDQQALQTKQQQLPPKNDKYLALILEQSEVENSMYSIQPSISSINYQESLINNQKQNFEFNQKYQVSQPNQNNLQKKFASQKDSDNVSQKLQQDFSQYLVNNQKNNNEKSDFQTKIEQEKIMKNRNQNRDMKIRQSLNSNTIEQLNNQSLPNVKMTYFDQQLHSQAYQQSRIKQSNNNISLHEQNNSQSQNEPNQIKANNNMDKKLQSEKSNQVKQSQHLNTQKLVYQNEQVNQNEQMVQNDHLKQGNMMTQSLKSTQLQQEQKQSYENYQQSISKNSPLIYNHRLNLNQNQNKFENPSINYEVQNKIKQNQNLVTEKSLYQNKQLAQNEHFQQGNNMTQSLKIAQIQQSNQQLQENNLQLINKIPLISQIQHQNVLIDQNKFQSKSEYEFKIKQQQDVNLNKAKNPVFQINQNNQNQIGGNNNLNNQINIDNQKSSNQQKIEFLLPIQQRDKNQIQNIQSRSSFHNNSFILNNIQNNSKIVKLQDNETSKYQVEKQYVFNKEEQNNVNQQKRDILNKNSLIAQQQQFVNETQDTKKFARKDENSKYKKTEEDFKKFQINSTKNSQHNQDNQADKQLFKFFTARNSFNDSSLSKYDYSNLCYQNHQNNTPKLKQSFQIDKYFNSSNNQINSNYISYQDQKCPSSQNQKIDQNISLRKKDSELNQYAIQKEHQKRQTLNQQKYIQTTDIQQKQISSNSARYNQQISLNTSFTQQAKK
ncbi:hypothetical protein ABPG72_018315 [Tetrahymena utriculariae]